jgi:tetratricopeptide (TPR) repeat protein
MPRLAPFAFIVIATSVVVAAPAAADNRAACFAQNLGGEKSIAACSRLLGKVRGSDRANLYGWRGSHYSAKGDYDRAIADFSESIRLNPKSAAPYHNRAGAYAAKGELDRALADYSEGIRLLPNNAASYTQRGFLYGRKGDRDRAIADYNEAIRLAPDKPENYNERGFQYAWKGEQDRAIADFTEAIRLNPKYAIAIHNRGVRYAAKGDHDRAIADLDEAIRLNPNLPESHYFRGVSHWQMSNYERAIADLNEAIRLNPRHARAYAGRGNAYTHKGDHDRAISDHDEAIRLAPKYANGYAHRGDALRRKGELDRALMDLEEALRLDPAYPYTYTYLGLLYEDKGDPGRARSYYNAALARPLKGSPHAHDIARERLATLPGAAAAAAARPPDTAAPTAATAAPAVTPVAAPPAAPSATTLVNPGRRVALVIGNGNYRHATQLPNPPNDAADISAALRKLGFEVVEGRDLDKRATEDKLREFSRKLAGAKLALFFYAGHGMQVAGRNYLVPIDAKLEQPGDLRLDTIDIADVLAQMEAEPRVNLVFLDACRDNPLARSFARSLGARSTTVGQGLAMVHSAIGTLIAYATQPDAVALDGDGRNSPFTTALLKHIATPRLDIGSILRRVRADVITATSQRQVPWDHSSLIGDVVLAQ